MIRNEKSIDQVRTAVGDDDRVDADSRSSGGLAPEHSTRMPQAMPTRSQPSTGVPRTQ